jgi:FtsZ-binding cell division protein ZapB
MKIIQNFILWSICLLFLSHNSACVSMTTGALEGAIENQERTNRIDNAANSLGFNQRELNDYVTKLNRSFECIDRVEGNPKYYALEVKSPEQPSFQHFADPTYITDSERKLLASYMLANEICLDLSRDGSYSSPLVVEYKMIVDRAVTELLFLSASLDNGEITWGNYNKKSEMISSDFEYRLNQWDSKMRSTYVQVASIVSLQEEAAALRRHRQALKNEFKKNQMQLQSMRNENRRLQNRKRHLESCSRYPGKYMNCPAIY